MLTPITKQETIKAFARLNNDSDFQALKDYLQANREKLQREIENPLEATALHYKAGALKIIREIFEKVEDASELIR